MTANEDQEKSDYYYLTMVVGTRRGANFLLRGERATVLGRGTDCHIILADPLCSREHAEISQVDHLWRVRDLDSRNGTFVNNEKVTETALEPGFRIKLGSSEFMFHSSSQPPTLETSGGVRLTESIVKEASLEIGDSSLAALRHDGPSRDAQSLYQLAVRLLGCDEPIEVIRATLQLLHERTRSGIAGFLWVSDEGQLKLQEVMPADTSERVSLSESLTRIVLDQKRAVWVANQSSVGSAESLKHYADALCVPLLYEGTTLGALHLYLNHGNFRQTDFDFAISTAHLLSVALARARRQATLAAEHQRLVESSASFGELIGQSEPMQKLKEKISRVARASGCVLIRGESGSGKELVARALHKASTRADRPMLSVNCAAIPADLMESQLFGHAQGAFTGATRAHEGWFTRADTGTLFLDEI
ncbi:MAG: sigma 54-interacting transcriptional regulator, partial [Planctomycetales bacterium]|nr:sigma 54-interacting transcriptional regulator [Planctomycetales bacterium]